MSTLRRRFKCCVIGEHGVGKTSIIQSMLGKSIENLQSTIGIDFFTTSILSNPRDIYLTIWDTAGAERFRSLMHSYARDSDIIMIVYDITNINAMQNVTYWIRQIEHNKPRILLIVGNKDDLSPATKHEIRDTIEPYKRQKWTIITTTCSSRNRDSVRKLFRRAITKLEIPPIITSETNNIVRFSPNSINIQQTCCA